jgi:hypothetical protein
MAFMPGRAPVDRGPLPRGVRREVGRDLGWIAATPSEYPLRIAVFGDDEAQAVDRFEQAISRWEAIPSDH